MLGVLRHLLARRAFWLLAVPLAASLALGGSFWRVSNLQNLVGGLAIEGIMCVGMTIVMVAGGFDLSIGSVMALAGVIVIDLEAWGLPVAVALALAAAAVAGLANGILVAIVGINPFIATLGTMVIVRALVLAYTSAEPISGTEPTLMELSRGLVLGVPLAGIVLVVLAALGHVVLTRMRIGREIHALGGNEAAARASGVDTVRLKILCYVLCSLSAGVAGIILAGRLNTGSPIVGEQAALNVITAVVLGGTSLAGGIGTVWGSLAGLLCVGMLENVLSLLDVPAYWQRIVLGLWLLAIIVGDRLGTEGRRRRLLSRATAMLGGGERRT